MFEMTLNERATYIQGLCDGVGLDASTKEGKVIAALVELISDMATTIEELEDEVAELRDYIEEIDEDLGDVEEVLCDADEYDDGLDCDGDCDSCCEDCDMREDDGEYFEVECPACGEVICFDESIDPEELICPACGEKFECLIDAEDLEALDKE